MSTEPLDLPTISDVNAGQEALFAKSIASATPPAPVKLSGCHNCGMPMRIDEAKCGECGVWQRVPEKREKSERETITIQLADCAGPGDAPMSARLKRAIKALGRSYKLRVISMKGTT